VRARPRLYQIKLRATLAYKLFLRNASVIPALSLAPARELPLRLWVFEVSKRSKRSNSELGSFQARSETRSVRRFGAGNARNESTRKALARLRNRDRVTINAASKRWITIHSRGMLVHSVTHDVTCHSAVSIHRTFRKTCSVSQNDSAGDHRSAGGRCFAFCFRKAVDSVGDHYAPRARLIQLSPGKHTARSVLSIRSARSASSEIPLSLSLSLSLSRRDARKFNFSASPSSRYHGTSYRRESSHPFPTFVDRYYLIHRTGI